MTFLTWNRPMTEIPASLIAFQRRFPDDDACARWLVAVRWPNGFRCLACVHDRGWQLKTGPHSFECACCHRQASVAAGTLLHRTKRHLRLAVAEEARDRILSQCLDARRQTSRCHGRPRTQPAVWSRSCTYKGKGDFLSGSDVIQASKQRKFEDAGPSRSDGCGMGDHLAVAA